MSLGNADLCFGPRKTAVTLFISCFLAPLTMLALLAGCSDDNGNNAPADKGPGDVKLDLYVAPDLPAPDVANPKKKPKIVQLIPSDGLSNGGKNGTGTPVLASGENFADGATLYIDSQPQAITVSVSSAMAMRFTMPKNPYDTTKPQKVTVMVYINSQFSNVMDFQYTVTKPLDSDHTGSVLNSSSEAFKDFNSDPIRAKVYIKGVTDTTTGKSTKLKVDIGYAKDGIDPTQEPGFIWSGARFSKDDGSYDEYVGELKVPLATTYDVAFRISYDSTGMNSWGEFYYLDTDETDLKYDTAKAATIKATDAPLGFCLSDADCLTQGLKMTCKLDGSAVPVIKKKNTCVECLQDSDCLKTELAWGHFCNTTTETCYCKTDAECAKHQLGTKCLTTLSSPRCGCTTDKNCPSGLICDPQYYYCVKSSS